MKEDLPPDVSSHIETIELAKVVLLAAIEYALIHNLPLPSDIYKQYIYKGELPWWIEEHYNDETKKHYHYYRFAIDEYGNIFSLLTGNLAVLNKPLKLDAGLKVLDFVRRHFVQKVPLHLLIDLLPDGRFTGNGKEISETFGNSSNAPADCEQDGSVCSP